MPNPFSSPGVNSKLVGVCLLAISITGISAVMAKEKQPNLEQTFSALREMFGSWCVETIFHRL